MHIIFLISFILISSIVHAQSNDLEISKKVFSTGINEKKNDEIINIFFKTVDGNAIVTFKNDVQIKYKYYKIYKKGKIQISDFSKSENVILWKNEFDYLVGTFIKIEKDKIFFITDSGRELLIEAYKYDFFLKKNTIIN